jgi:hypothetical protein
MSIPLHPVTSSNVAAVGHDPVFKELHVQFKDGKTYVFSDVSAEEHEALLKAKSVGSHLHAHIRAKKRSRKK